MGGGGGVDVDGQFWRFGGSFTVPVGVSVLGLVSLWRWVGGG